MGNKGERRTETAREAAADAVEALEELGEVTSKGMFGGYGIFRDGVMFGLVNSAGTLHLRVSPETREKYEAMDAAPHGRMPYFEVPEPIRSDSEKLVSWAAEAADVAASARS